MGLVTATLLAAAWVGLTATIDFDGSVRLERDGQTVATVAYETALAGWTWAGVSPGTEAGTTVQKVPGGQVRVVTKLFSEGDNIRLTVEATPDTDVAVESTHVSMKLEAGMAGSPTETDGKPGALPSEPGELHFFTGKLKSFSVAGPRDRVAVSFDEPVESLLQDSRRFGSGFDLRFGVPSAAGKWPKGETRKYSVLIGTGGPITILPAEPFVLEAGPDWIPLETKLDVIPGSALDWAPARPEPAGAHGRVIINREGRFAFDRQPGKNVRFYGANLVFSAAMPDKATSDVLAERLMRLGYNTVRLHHFDGLLTSDGNAANDPSSTDPLPDPLDRMDYLIAAMKKRGIYTKIDFYTIRQIRKDEIIPGELGMDEFKALLLVNEKARENWWAFTKNLLDHKNPYTNLKWKDDPAIAFVSPVNENTFGSASRAMKAGSRAFLDAAWKEAGHAGEFSYETDEGARFAAKLHTDAYEWMKKRIRGIGCQALLTDVNGWHDQTALMLHRQHIDFVDNHNYWDHPSFLTSDWGLPSRGWSGGGMATRALGGGLQNLALTRVAGKPFTVSEFNFVAPNRYRAEGGLFMGALAARQDWDAMWRFAWSHNAENLKAPMAFNYFDVQADPAMLASERAIISLFLRGDLAPAMYQKILQVDPMTAGAKGFSAPVTQQIMDVKVGSSLAFGDPIGGAMSVPGMSPVKIDRDAGILTIDTSRTAGAFAPADTEVRVGALTATIEGQRAALWASSTDGQPLRVSKRILLTHLTDVQNTGIRFTAQNRDVLTAWGELPHLVRAGSASIRLSAQRPEKLRVFRLDMAGKRVEPVPVEASISAIEFRVSVAGPDGATLYYEIVRE